MSFGGPDWREWVLGAEAGKEFVDRAIEQELDNSLDRLRMDTLDLLQIHRWDYDAPIVGTTSVEHLEDAVEALSIDLSTSEIEYREEPYQPMQVSGHE